MPRRRFLKGGAGLSALAALGAGGAAASALTGCASDLAGTGKLPLPRPGLEGQGAVLSLMLLVVLLLPMIYYVIATNREANQ